MAESENGKMAESDGGAASGNGSDSDEERADRFQKGYMNGEEALGYFMDPKHFRSQFPDIKKRPVPKKAKFAYNGKLGVLLDMSIDEGSFRTKVTKCSEDGVRNSRNIIKKKHLKDKSKYKDIWSKLVNNQCAVRVTAPRKLSNDADTPVYYGITKIPDGASGDDPDSFRSAAEEFWGGEFFEGTEAPQLQDGWSLGGETGAAAHEKEAKEATKEAEG